MLVYMSGRGGKMTSVERISFKPSLTGIVAGGFKGRLYLV